MSEFAATAYLIAKFAAVAFGILFFGYVCAKCWTYAVLKGKKQFEEEERKRNVRP